ncbi:hypothetical protein DSN88_09455, partial [Campylobacter jejuni]|nr:hypothetical protein [Campylobacter jejuni]
NSGIMMQGTIQTFNNSGTIKGNNNHGIQTPGKITIDTLNNSGLILGNGSYSGAIIIGNWENSMSVNTIKNSGTLMGVSGIATLYTTINLIQNTGTIISTKHQVGAGGTAGIQLHSSNIGTVINSGYIKSESTYGIELITYTGNTTLNNLINSGTIEGDLDGLFITQGTSIKTIENTGVIKGGNAGINVDFKSWNTKKNGT